MNERIQELHQQAKDFINEMSDADGVYQGKEYMQAVREKFAELLIKECAELVGGYTKENEFGSASDVKEAYEEITKHFGVK